MKTLFLFISALLWSSLQVLCQSSEEDSLNNIIIDSNQDTTVAECYVALTEILYVTNPDTVIPLCEKAVEFIDQRFDKASKQEQNSFLRTKATAYNNIGYIHDSKGRIHEALDYYFKAIKIQEKLGDKSGLSSSYTNTGYLYKQQKDYESAKKYYMKSLKIKEELGDTAGIARIYLNMGGFYDEQGYLEEAARSYFKSLDLWKLTGIKKGIAAATNNLGFIYNAKGNIDSALYFYKEAEKIYHSLDHKEGMGSVSNNIATIYYKQGDYRNALIYAQEAMRIAREISYTENIIDASHILEQIYVKTNNWKDAHEMAKIHEHFSDTLFNEQTRKASLKKEIEYEYEKKQAIREVEHEKEIELANAEKEKQFLVIVIVSVGLLLVIILSIIIYKRLLFSRRQHNLIKAQQAEILDKNEELNMQNEEITAISEKIEEQNEVLSKQNHDILSSIEYAKKIQEAILPRGDFFSNNLPNSFVLYLPKDIVSGDFYWMERVGELVYFAAVDCTGHGVPGAFMSIIGANGLNRVVREMNIQEPAEVLEELTKYVISRVNPNQDDLSVRDGMDIALCCLNTQTNQLQYAGAYNPLYLIRNNELIQYKATKRPVGLYKRENIPPFQNKIIQLEKNDAVYIFSDGFADQFGGPKNKKYTYHRLREKLLEIHRQEIKEQKLSLMDEFLDWKGTASQLDDICIIGFRV